MQLAWHHACCVYVLACWLRLTFLSFHTQTPPPQTCAYYTPNIPTTNHCRCEGACSWLAVTPAAPHQPTRWRWLQQPQAGVSSSSSPNTRWTEGSSSSSHHSPRCLTPPRQHTNSGRVRSRMQSQRVALFCCCCVVSSSAEASCGGVGRWWWAQQNATAQDAAATNSGKTTAPPAAAGAAAAVSLSA